MGNPHDARRHESAERGERQHITVDEDLPAHASHRIVEEVRHALFHDLPLLGSIAVHVDPCGHGVPDKHVLTGHHAQLREPA